MSREPESMDRELEELSDRCRLLGAYIRDKADQLLVMMGSKPLDASDVGDRTLIALDPIGTIAESFSQVIAHLHDINDQLRSEIAERQRTEEALREKEGRFRTLAEFASDWVFWRGPGGNLIYVAPACEAITGYPPSAFYANPGLAESIIHPEDRARWEAHRHVADQQGAPGALEFRIVTKEGETRWISHVCRPVYGEDGAFLGVRGSNTNVTAKKRMEEEIQKASTLESIGILAGGIAHDFNNILTAILGNISLARLELPPGAVSVRLEDAAKASLRAKSLTQQLLTFSRGGAPIRNPASAEELIRETAGFALRGSNVRCTFDIAADLWPVIVDEAQVSQVINNVIINADQAMPGGGNVEVRAENVAVRPGEEPPLAEGDYVRISIRDQGVGISREDLARIFNPFFTTKETGTGLGLTTASSIIKRHEGTIRAESELGVGTTVSIYLPAARKSPRTKSDNGGPVAAGRGRILVMDDEEVLRDVAVDMLGMIGYEVTAVQDGAEALAAYRAAMDAGRRFDAVIMDLTVPGGMGGREAVAKLREIDPAVRAVVSSGYFNDPVMSDFRRHGFSGVIAKPYTVQEIGEVLGRILSAPCPIPKMR